jgi:hypothetical protein
MKILSLIFQHIKWLIVCIRKRRISHSNKPKLEQCILLINVLCSEDKYGPKVATSAAIRKFSQRITYAQLN